MYTVRRICQIPLQLLVSIFLKILFLPILKRNLEDLPETVPRAYLVVSNHRRMIDPMVIAAAMPYRVSLKIFPFGFMTSNKYYDSPLRPLVWLAGCFPARNNTKEAHSIFGVEGSAKLLRHNFSVFIFPEGRLARKGRLPAHSGVIRISQAALEVPMLLCHVTYNRGLRPLLRRDFATVRFTVIEWPGFDDPELILDAIYAL